MRLSMGEPDNGVYHRHAVSLSSQIRDSESSALNRRCTTDPKWCKHRLADVGPRLQAREPAPVSPTAARSGTFDSCLFTRPGGR